MSIYTDGLKQDEKVACAVISPNFTDSIRIPDNSSILPLKPRLVRLHFIILGINSKNSSSFIQILFLSYGLLKF